VIQSFRHAGIEKFFLTGSKASIQPKHADKLSIQGEASGALVDLGKWKLASDI